MEPGISSAHENPLTKELEACKDSETNLTNIFSSVVDELNDQLETWKKKYSSMLDDNVQKQLKNEKLQNEDEQPKAKESELVQKLMEAEDRGTQAIKRD